MTIRKITEKDVRQIAEIHKESIKEAFFSKLGLGFLAYLYTRMFKQKGTFFGYCYEDKKTKKIAGFVTVVIGKGFFSKLVIEDLPRFIMNMAAANVRHPSATISLLQTLFCLSKDKDEAQSEIFSIGVLPEYQRKGIGKSLLEEALNALRDKNITNVRVLVDSKIKANDFYKRQGFSLKGRVSALKRVLNIYKKDMQRQKRE